MQGLYLDSAKLAIPTALTTFSVSFPLAIVLIDDHVALITVDEGDPRTPLTNSLGGG